MFSLGWLELNDRHFLIEEVTIVCGIFRGFSVLDGVFPVSGLFLFFTSGCSSFQEIFVHFCTALRIPLRSCLTGLAYRNTIGN